MYISKRKEAGWTLGPGLIKITINIILILNVKISVQKRKNKVQIECMLSNKNPKQ